MRVYEDRATKMIYAIIAPLKRGIVGKETIENLESRIFPCGHCTISDIAVYHNVLGRHVHIHGDASEYDRIRELAAEK